MQMYFEYKQYKALPVVLTVFLFNYSYKVHIFFKIVKI